MKKKQPNKTEISHKLDFKHNRMLQIASVVFVFMIFAFVYNKFLPWQIEAIIIATAATGVLLIGFNRLPRSLQITGIIIMLLGSLGLTYTQSLLNRAFNQLTVEKSTVSFVVMKDSKIEDLKDGSKYRYGISDMIDSDLKQHAIDEVKKDFKFDLKTESYVYDNNAYAALLSNEIEVLIIDNALVTFVETEYPDFWEEVRVVYEISKDYTREEIKTDKNFKKDPFVVYISGIDINGPLTSKSRSDVNILMFVNPNKGEILQVTIPRDYYVPIACQKNVKDKLTHAGNGGVGCSISTIENYMDIKIDLYARVNFTSFINIINVIGDINVYSEYSFRVGTPEFLVKKGMNTFNAEQALSFARERYKLPNGDIDRGLNQQEVIKGVINKLTSPAQIFNIEKIIKQTAKSVDTNATSDILLDLVNRQIKDNIQWKFTSMSMEGTGSMLPAKFDSSKLIYYMQPRADVEAKVYEKIKEIMGE